MKNQLPTESKSLRLDQLTFIRFVAAIGIVIYHYGRNLWPFNVGIINTVIDQINVGVSFFFTLSGFVMVIAYGTKQMTSSARTRYYFQRFSRIYPVYLLALISTCVLRVLADKHVRIDALIFNILALQSWLPQYPLSLNFPGWSICVEFFFYALFPLLIRIYSRSNLIPTIAAVCVFWLMSQIAFHIAINFQGELKGVLKYVAMYNPTMHLSEFLLGNLAALIFLKSKIKSSPIYGYAALLLTLVMMALLILKPAVVNFHNGLMAPVFVFIILALAWDNGTVQWLLKHPLLVFAGEISFTLYIMQVPVRLGFDLVINYIPIASDQAQFYIYLTVLITTSSLVYLIIEKPTKSLLNKQFYSQGRNHHNF